MANLTRRTADREPALFGRSDPFRSIRNLIRWDPFREILRGDPLSDVPGFERAWGSSYLPEVEVKETPEAFLITADVPGVREEDLDVSITGSVLSVSGKREEDVRDEGPHYFSSERSYGSFCRSFTLPDGCDAENVKADLKNGVLMVTVPKKGGQQARRVEIGAKKAEPQLEAKQSTKAA